MSIYLCVCFASDDVFRVSVSISVSFGLVLNLAICQCHINVNIYRHLLIVPPISVALAGATKDLSDILNGLENSAQHNEGTKLSILSMEMQLHRVYQQPAFSTFDSTFELWRCHIIFLSGFTCRF